MKHELELPTFKMDADKAIPLISQKLTRAGLQVIPSFDLQTVRAGQIQCICPHHGTDQCDCQMVVLLIYGSEATPTTLVAHGHEGKTYLSLVDKPHQRPETGVPNLIRQALLVKAQP